MEETVVATPAVSHGHQVIEPQQRLFIEAELDYPPFERWRSRVFWKDDRTSLADFGVQCRTRELIRAHQRKANQAQKARRPRSGSPQWSHAGALVRLSHENPALEDLRVMERMSQGGMSFEDIGYVFGVSKWSVMHYLSRYRTLKARAEAIAQAKADAASRAKRKAASLSANEDPAEMEEIAKALRELDARTTVIA